MKNTRERNTDNLLVRYLPELRRLNALDGGPGSEKRARLSGFEKANWKTASQDPLTEKAAQDVEVESTYLKPALQAADSLGIKSALGKGLLYDIIIQHGRK